MGKISIMTLDEASLVPANGVSKDVETRAFFQGDEDPIHLHLFRLAANAAARIGPEDTDSAVFVWRGAVEAGGHALKAGSSVIVERGAAIDLRGKDDDSQLLMFRAARPSPGLRAGGHVHLLPAERVPRAASLPKSPGVGGALHADSSCPTCLVWLHENDLPPASEEDAGERRVHSHSADEVIFVTGGQMRLGARLYGPGSAIAIPAETFYGFGIGPDGLKFVNFRPALSEVFRLKDGTAVDEAAYWRDQLPAPDYLSPVSGAR